MSWVTLLEARTYIGLEDGDSTKDDVLINDAILDGQKFLEEEIGFLFEASTQTRYYHAIDDLEEAAYGRKLRLDYPLLTVTTLTNGDGNEIPSSEYILRPVNDSPKYMIEIKRGSAYRFQYSTSPESAISVEGTWGYSATCPYDVRHGLLEMIRLMYIHKDSGVLGTVSYVSGGKLVFREGLPRFILALKARYGRKL